MVERSVINRPVKIIDREFNFLGEIDDYESLIFTRSWSGIGSFELHINANKNNTEQLQKENIIFLNEKKAGVILYRELSTEDNEQLIIKGHTLKAYIGRRITVPPVDKAYDYKNDYAENIIKHYVDTNCINPTDTKRKVDRLVIGPTKSLGPKIQYQTRFKNLAEEIEKISEASGLGWDVYLDLKNKQFVFEVYEGNDRTSSQNKIPPAIFSIEYDNISSQKLIDSKINYRNIVYVGGQGEGADRAIEVVGTETYGLDRYEAFIDARDIEDDTRLADRGLQKLKEYEEVFTFDNDILTQSNLIYEEDYDLGDVVTTLNKKWNVTLDSRITEITEIYESDGFKINAVFGNNIPTIIDKIKQELDIPLVEKGLLEKGDPGIPGADGVGIEYSWNGTELGIKREDEATYTYVNLVGPKGERGPQGIQGPQGIPGLNGKSIEFTWNGTQLGIRQEGQTLYQYVDLKGEKGDTGPQGERGPQGIQGKTGPMGPQGKSIEYVWNGTKLGIRVEGETSYTYVDLRGPQGLKGDKGPAGSDANVTKENVINAIGYTPANSVHKHSKSEIMDFPSSLPANGGNAYLADVLKVIDNRSDSEIPSDFFSSNGRKVHANFKYKSSVGNPPIKTASSYVFIVTIAGWSDPSGGYPVQIAFGVEGTAYRYGVSNESWSNWTKILNINDMPTKLSQFENDIGAGVGLNIVTSPTEPTGLKPGDWWFKEV